MTPSYVGHSLPPTLLRHASFFVLMVINFPDWGFRSAGNICQTSQRLYRTQSTRKKKWCQCALFRKCQPVLVVHTRVQEQGLSYKSINLIENSSGPPDCHRIRMHPTSPTLRNEFFLAIVLLANVFGQSI